jgi:hypothetical protein
MVFQHTGGHATQYLQPVSHLYSFTLYWNVKEIVEIQNAHSMVYLITSMHESFYVMNIFLNYSQFSIS